MCDQRTRPASTGYRAQRDGEAIGPLDDKIGAATHESGVVVVGDT